MRRTFILIVGLVLVAIACGPQDVTEESTTTTSTTASTTTIETPTTRSPNGSTSTTVPSPPPIVAGTWTETRSSVPDGVFLGSVVAGSPGFVVPGWHDKIPGVQGATSGLWFSADGSSWEEVTPAIIDLEWVDYNGGIWTGSQYLVTAEGVMNAENTGSAIEGDGPLLFRSADGRNWSVDIVDAAFLSAAPSLGRLYMTPELIQAAGLAGFTDIAVGPDGLLVTGWLNTSNGTEATVWSSSDGDTWTVRALPGAEPNVRADRIERGPLGYLITGGQQAIGGGGGTATVVWRSSDGRSWGLLNDQSSDYPGVEPLVPELWYHRDVAVGATGYLMSGALWSDTGAIDEHLWFSPDGKAWTGTEPFPGQDPYIQDVASDDHGFIAVGCQTVDNQPVASVWRSTDGSSWALEPVTFPSACMDQIERVGGTWIASGSNGHPDPTFNPSDYWRPTEFLIWTAPVTTEVRSVVLVPADDVLNVRSGPGVENEVVTTLAPTATGVALTGNEAQVGSSTWVKIVTDDGTGWVNEQFLAEPDSPANPFSESFGIDLVDGLAAVFVGRGDLTEAASHRGIFVAHHDRARPFTNLDGLLTDPTLHPWAGNGCSPEECPDETPKLTFAEGVADSFLGAWNDDDRRVSVDEVIPGGNGMLEDFIVPTEFENLHFVAVKDPGDNPDYGGMDWYTWYVYFTYENDVPVVLGMSIDAWAP